MVEMLRRELAAARPDLLEIARLIPRNSRVLDLGCGNGALLRLLAAEKNVNGVGVEISQAAIIECVSAGVPVIHGDLNERLGYFADQSRDFVILSQTLQALRHPDRVLDEMLRIGGKGVVGFINFGFISLRLQLIMTGGMPQSANLPHRWYDTPNIHLGTVRDFRRLCREKRFRIEAEIPLGGGLAGVWSNLFAQTCVFVISKAVG